MTAEVIKISVFSAQVCVPKDWTDDQIVKLLADHDTKAVEDGRRARGDATPFEPSVATIRREGPNYAERVPCSEHADHVHVVLDY